MKSKIVCRSATAYIVLEGKGKSAFYALRSGFSRKWVHNGEVRYGSGFFRAFEAFEKTPEGLAAAKARFEECVKAEGGLHTLVETNAGTFIKRDGYGFIALLKPSYPNGLQTDCYVVEPQNVGVDIHREDPNRLRELANGLLTRLEAA